MPHKRLATRPALRWPLGLLLLFAALNAFGGGWYGLSGAPGVPTEWLRGTPFSDYCLPSLFLMVVVGGTFLVAGVAVLGRLSWQRAATFAAGGLALAWIAVQVSMIGYVSWMQPATFVAGLVMLVLGLFLPKRVASAA